MSEYLDLFSEIESDFLNYVDCFVDDDEEPEFLKLIDLKKEHSLKVSELSGKIAESENFDDKIILLCKVGGIMHDIGRFEQLNFYRTLDDLKSVDHGDLGHNVLSNTGFLEHFSTSEQLALLYAVKNHNKRYVTDYPDEISEIITKVIRDADKLDVYRVMQASLEKESDENKSAVLLDLEKNGKISDEVYQQFKNHKVVNKQQLKSAADFLVMQLSWIFDVNYNSTFNLITNSEGYQYLTNILKNNELFDDIKENITQYIKQKSTK
ncbi:MAG TPA: HD domain-containing protein [Salinivirgaceae bacterium]|nr:HD domain-containing protein [Salinivirgaceae bacterium]